MKVSLLKSCYAIIIFLQINLIMNSIGSFSYSWNNGPFHFVQLQNHPDYNTHFYNWYVGDGGYRAYYNITKSLEWLENDLEAHKDSHIILNFHVNTFSAGLQTLLSKYKVLFIPLKNFEEISTYFELRWQLFLLDTSTNVLGCINGLNWAIPSVFQSSTQEAPRGSMFNILYSIHVQTLIIAIL